MKPFFCHIGYYLSRFPLVSTTFIQREVYALEAAGLNLEFFASRQPPQNGFHPEDTPLFHRTVFLEKASAGELVQAHLFWFFTRLPTYLWLLCRCFFLVDGHPRQIRNNLKYFIAAALLAQQCRHKRIRHLHVHFAFEAAQVACFVKMLAAIPYSLSIHGSDVLLRHPLQRLKLTNASRIITNCLYHIDNLRSRFPGLRTVPFHLVRIRLDLGAPRWQTAPFPAVTGAFSLLAIGRLHPVKGHHLLVTACVRLKEAGVPVRCTIAGEGRERPALEQQIDELSCSDIVSLAGQCFEPQIERLITDSHVVVLSSLSEGTPMTLIEAMAKGRPVVAPNITAIPEMVKESHNGYLFRRGDANALFESLFRCWQERHALPKMGQNGRKTAEKLFDATRNRQTLLRCHRLSVNRALISNKKTTQS